MLRLLNQNSSQRHGESGNVPRGVVRAPSTSTDNGRKSKSKSTPDLDAFFRKHKLSQKLKKNLKELGITSLDQLLRMKDKQILMYANLDGFDKSLSSELILLTGALDEHRKQAKQGSGPVVSSEARRFHAGLAKHGINQFNAKDIEQQMNLSSKVNPGLAEHNKNQAVGDRLMLFVMKTRKKRTNPNKMLGPYKIAELPENKSDFSQADMWDYITWNDMIYNGDYNFLLFGGILFGLSLYLFIDGMIKMWTTGDKYCDSSCVNSFNSCSCNCDCAGRNSQCGSDINGNATYCSTDPNWVYVFVVFITIIGEWLIIFLYFTIRFKQKNVCKTLCNAFFIMCIGATYVGVEILRMIFVSCCAPCFISWWVNTGEPLLNNSLSAINNRPPIWRDQSTYNHNNNKSKNNLSTSKNKKTNDNDRKNSGRGSKSGKSGNDKNEGKTRTINIFKKQEKAEETTKGNSKHKHKDKNKNGNKNKNPKNSTKSSGTKNKLQNVKQGYEKKQRLKYYDKRNNSTPLHLFWAVYENKDWFFMLVWLIVLSVTMVVVISLWGVIGENTDVFECPDCVTDCDVTDCSFYRSKFSDCGFDISGNAVECAYSEKAEQTREDCWIAIGCVYLIDWCILFVLYVLFCCASFSQAFILSFIMTFVMCSPLSPLVLITMGCKMKDNKRK